MRSFLTRWLALAAVAAAVAFPQPVPAADASAGPDAWRKLPWHLVDIHHRMPPLGRVDSIEITLDIEGDIRPADHVYIGAAWGKLNGKGVYFGLLSNLFDPRKKTTVGHGVIFSRWGKAVAGDIRAAPGSIPVVGEAATSGEGDFASVRQPFAWGPGRYTFAVRSRPAARGETGSWMDLLVFEHAAQQWRDIGGLRFPDETLKLGKLLVSFVEIYRDRRKGVRDFPEALPDAAVTLDVPVVNRRYEPVTTKAVFTKTVPRIVDVSETFGVTRVSFDDAAYQRLRGAAAATVD
jgi:hypothetical protein